MGNGGYNTERNSNIGIGTQDIGSQGFVLLGSTGKDHASLSVKYTMGNRTRNQDLILV